MTGDLTKIGTWCPFAVKRPITTGEFWANPGEPKLAICEHITAGNDSRSFLQNTSNQSSTHFLIGIYDGKPDAIIYQFAPLEFAMWGNGITGNLDNPDMPKWVHDRIVAGRNMNLCTISVEHESPYPMPHPFDERILAASEKLNKWIKSVQPSVKSILGHFMIDNVRRPFCPGGPHGKDFPFARMEAAISNVPPVPTPPPTPPPTPDTRTAIERYHDETGGFGEYGFALEVDGVERIKERTLQLPDVAGAPFQCGFYQKGVIVWRADLGASRYNSGAWLFNSLVKLGVITV